jgi:hypothetical protein
MYRRGHRKVAFWYTLISIALIGLMAATPASASSRINTKGTSSKPGLVTPKILNGSTYFEVDTPLWGDDGELYLMQLSPGGGLLTGTGLMGGWNNASLIAGLQNNDLLEVTGDELVEWVDPGSGYQRYHLDWGWSNARLMATLDSTNFVEIKTDGSLWQWHRASGASGFTGRQVGNGWGNTRLIAGLATNDFLQVTGDELVEWSNIGVGYQGIHRDWGWSNAQLVVGISATEFVEYKTDTTMWQWDRSGYGFEGFVLTGPVPGIRLVG